MTIAIDPKADWEWIDDPDRKLADDDPHKTKWTLRPLSPTEEATIQDNVSLAGMGDDEAETKTSGFGTIALRTIRLALVGCENFRGPDGTEYKIQRGKTSAGVHFVQEGFLAKIPSATRSRMCNAITTRGSVTEKDEVK